MASENGMDEFLFALRAGKNPNGLILAARGERAELEAQENGPHIDDHLPDAETRGIETGLYVWSGQISYPYGDDTDIRYEGSIAPATNDDFVRFGVRLLT